MTALSLILRDPLFRAIAAMAGLYGAVNACIYPYLSLIAVERVGISDATLALVLALASGAAVTLLDQPFAALDFGSIRIIKEFLSDAATHTSRAWIVADHTASEDVRWVSVLNLAEPGT
jgi:ABC-type taurine transport system ATPase subunit